MKPPIPFLPLLPLLLSTTIPPSSSVDRSKFRTCQQTSFCRRHRHRTPHHKYRLDPSSLSFSFPPSSSKSDDNDSPAPEKKKTGAGLFKSLFGKGGDEDDPPSSSALGPQPVLTGRISNGADSLNLAISLHSDGVSRIRLTEDNDRWISDDVVLNVDEMTMPTAVEYLEGDKLKSIVDDPNNYRGLTWGDDNGITLLVKLNPFEVELTMHGETLAKLNSRQMLYFERKRQKDGTPDADLQKQRHMETTEKKHDKEVVGYWEDGLAIYADGTREERGDKENADLERLEEIEDSASEDEDTEGLWEEKFQSHVDSKPNGPMSVGIDVMFPTGHIYGLPEHASSTPLRATFGPGATYTEPYRLYNLDVFEYDLDTTMALYGSVPLVISHSASATAGMFYFNPTETFVDVDLSREESSVSHFMSESGVLDLFLLSGPTVGKVYEQYAHLTGRTPLPPVFALGYHQCRWNYRDEKDVYQVHSHFEKYDYPYDVLWLDIEHTNDKRYFTWNKDLFPHPKVMQNKLASDGRKMVTIVDPHIKRDNNYYIHKEATAKGYYIKNKDGSADYDGWCWPGSSSYLDFTSAVVRKWFASQFAFNKYQESTPTLHTWNDMNEPSVFNGPEVSMQKDLLNLQGIEHREWHNLYGMLFQRATHEGLIDRFPQKDERGFVLSRAFFAGSQRYGAIWTGDNAAEWSHLAIATPMLLSLNIGGIFFSGADVGGFFKDTSPELMTRWMQAGAYQPFFRGHAHHDTKRKEPWVFGDEVMVRLRQSAMERYALLPYWYGVFREAMVTGMPVMRTMWMEYPKVKGFFDVDDQYMVGGALLVKPVVREGETIVEVRFPTDDLWYDARTLQKRPVVRGESGVHNVQVEAPIDKIPVYQRGGTIIPRKLRLRRSSKMMTNDPYTLYVALNRDGKATGEVYVDDEHSFAYTKGNFCLSTIAFDLSEGTMTSRVEKGEAWKLNDSQVGKVERIVVMGLEKEPKAIKVKENDVRFEYNNETKLLVMKLPTVLVTLEWDMTLLF